MQAYRPSKKGLKWGINEHSRIFFLDSHYVFFVEQNGTYAFEDGDVFEWKPKMKKPDSLWVTDKDIDPKMIANSEGISEYNRIANVAQLSQMGLSSKSWLTTS